MKLSEALRDDPGQLASARAAAGLSISRLARRMGVSRAAVRKWEKAGVPAARLGAVSAELDEAPTSGPGPLEQLAALAAAEPGLTEARFRVRAGRLASDIERAEQAGLLHRARTTATDAAERRYSQVRVQPGPAPSRCPEKERPRLGGTDVAGLRRLHGWSQRELAGRLGVTRQRVTELERDGVPDGRQEQLRRLLVEPLTAADVIAARERTGLTQAQLARRLGYKAPAPVNNWERGKRPLPLAQAVRIGHVLAAAAGEDPAEDARRRVVEIVTAAGPDGCTRQDLRRALSQGRRPGKTGATALDAAGLERALRRRQVHWRETWTRRRDGASMRSSRLRPGPPPRVADEPAMSGSELRQAREDADVSQSELAADLGTVWGTVSKWEHRGSRPVPSWVAAAAPEALRRRVAARPDPLVLARTQLRAAAAAEPGLPSWRLLEVAGYGKGNRTAHGVLAELLDAGELHLRVTPKRGISGARLAIHPGPAPETVERPTPLPGAELRRLRRAAGLRQRDLAAALGVSQTAVTHWEHTAVPPLRARAVAQALEDLGREQTEPLSGEQLRRARQAAGLSQAALGARLGVAQVAVSSWERRGIPRGRVDAVREALSPAV